jgi:hypothetical protein
MQMLWRESGLKNELGMKLSAKEAFLTVNEDDVFERIIYQVTLTTDK